ncbi:cation:proton antiporter [Candidatus Bathyarchaeota archaeon]|nr:cation:proton antiporter [Candidatus Bathyarchaeota archaeon]
MIFLVLIASFLFSRLLKRIGLPIILGQIMSGIILGLPLIRVMFDSVALSGFDLLSTLGIVFLLFLAGLEIETKLLKETAWTSILIGLAATFTPMTLGIILLIWLDYSFTVALVFGIVVSVTAGGTIIGILMDLNAVNTRLGAIFLTASTVDDVLEIFLLSFVTILIQGGSYVDLAFLPLQIAIFVTVAFAAVWILRKVLPYIHAHSISDSRGTELFSIALIVLIGMAALSESLSIGYLIGAIFAGFLIQLALSKVVRRNRHELLKNTRLISMAFVVPFFFANIGFNFNLAMLFENPLLTGFAVLITVVGSIMGVALTKPFSKLSFRQLYVVGWAMSSKGSVDVVVALLAQKYGLLPPEIFNAIVAMAIISTLTFPLVLKREISKNRAILN